MAYFPNGSAVDDYQHHYCRKCVNDKNSDCPILALHLAWNYDAVGDNKDVTKETALNIFIPREAGENQRCKMFVPMADEEARSILNRFMDTVSPAAQQ